MPLLAVTTLKGLSGSSNQATSPTDYNIRIENGDVFASLPPRNGSADYIAGYTDNQKIALVGIVGVVLYWLIGAEIKI